MVNQGVRVQARTRTRTRTRVHVLVRTRVSALPHHFHNSVFQPRSSWITSGATPLYTYVLCISMNGGVFRKTCAHTAPQAHSYIAASTEKGGARFENSDTP
jgi:hypothetical protein